MARTWTWCFLSTLFTHICKWTPDGVVLEPSFCVKAPWISLVNQSQILTGLAGETPGMWLMWPMMCKNTGKRGMKERNKKMAKEHDHVDQAPCAHHPTAFLEKHRTNLKIRQWSWPREYSKRSFGRNLGGCWWWLSHRYHHGPGGDCGSWVTKFVMLVDNVDRDFNQELWASTWKELWDSHETYETCNHCTQHDSTIRVRVFHGFSPAWNGLFLSDPKIPIADPQSATQHPSNKPWQMSGFRRALRSTGRECAHERVSKWGMSKTTASDCLPEEWNPDVDPWTAKSPHVTLIFRFCCV